MPLFRWGDLRFSDCVTRVRAVAADLAAALAVTQSIVDATQSDGAATPTPRPRLGEALAAAGEEVWHAWFCSFPHQLIQHHIGC